MKITKKPTAMPLSPQDIHRITRALPRICKEAGNEILKHYKKGVEIHHKADNSPCTQADLAANAHILKELGRLFPSIPVITEESANQPANGHQLPYFLVDPLDGTKEFIHKRDEFTVNIALMVNYTPIYGCVYAPVYGETFMVASNGEAVFSDKTGEPRLLKCRTLGPRGGVIVTASKSHSDTKTEAFLKLLPVKTSLTFGSSLKFCRLAQGVADIYPRFGPTCEWDTAAAHAVLRAAGGEIFTQTGNPLTYGKKDMRNPAFLACTPALCQQYLPYFSRVANLGERIGNIENETP